MLVVLSEEGDVHEYSSPSAAQASPVPESGGVHRAGLMLALGADRSSTSGVSLREAPEP
jgi:hypothetical protein